MSTTPGGDWAPGHHRRVIGQRARLLPIGTSVQGVGTLAHQPVKCRRTGLSELLDGSGVETVDGDGDHMINWIIGILGRMIICGVRKDR
jgi:hypothetical protein